MAEYPISEFRQHCHLPKIANRGRRRILFIDSCLMRPCFGLHHILSQCLRQCSLYHCYWDPVCNSQATTWKLCLSIDRFMISQRKMSSLIQYLETCASSFMDLSQKKLSQRITIREPSSGSLTHIIHMPSLECAEMRIHALRCLRSFAA